MKRMTTAAGLALLGLAVSACATQATGELSSRAPPSTSDPASAASYAPIDPERLSQLTRAFAADELQGRAPGTEGERRTIEWLSGQFAALGLEPGGENGGWTQRVPLIRTQVQSPASFSVRSHGETLTLQSPSDIYVSTVRAAERARIEAAPMVFVGYGVSAPERQWDDFKDADLTGKVAVFLVNDPDFEAQPGDPVAGRFGGQAMTYYGRWAYKFEEAARRGAIAALVVHETEAAGYGWNTVEAPAGENYNVVLPPDARQPVLLQGWIQWDAAADLLRRAGQDLAAVKRQARTAAFRPIDLGATLSADLPVTVEAVESHNVIARLPGASRPDETIVYGVHWDAYGIGPADARGDRIRNGAHDDALGTAAMLEVARAFREGPPPERSIVFAAWTAEERGLLGSEYYARNPLYPLETTVANITLDTLQSAGPARDVILIGEGQSEMEDWLARMAASQGRRVTPDSHPERGLFYRADHFSLAKRGVPVLLLMALGGGADLVQGGREAGDAWVTRFTADCYHQPCDDWSADWDLRGAAQDGSLAYRIGRELAFTDVWPGWREASEFRAVRERSAERRR
ncbi:M28 family metallopeptidase [Sphingosinicella terrae]|uniref:M28 family metallopeptidase n=1 Tax=Sphingosinicella terrae TaxID=2172047 RepID=UPI002546B10B|nr:M28 family peptidase [Sphingosinicella terrae]